MLIAASQGQATDPVQGVGRRRRPQMVPAPLPPDMRSMNKLKVSELMSLQTARAQWTSGDLEEIGALLPFFDVLTLIKVRVSPSRSGYAESP